jgi:hypothetical protein
MEDTMSITEREKFMTRLSEATKAGLVDQKFFFHPDRAFEPEEIFGAMNEVEDAIKGGRCQRHSGWDGNDAIT